MSLNITINNPAQFDIDIYNTKKTFNEWTYF